MGMDPEKVIQEATSHGYAQLAISKMDGGHVLQLDGSRMLSFRNENKCGGVNIKVYQNTGTVVTSLDHPQNGRSQIFRRNMNVQDLKEIFEDPKTFTNNAFHRIPKFGFKYNGNRSMIEPSCSYRFGAHSVDSFFNNVSGQGIDSISLGHNSFTILYTDGTMAWSSDLPRYLYNKLNGRQRWLPRPEVVALGLRSSESYFLQFADGEKSWWDLPHELEEAVEENGPVDLIAIGGNDHFYVRFKDGSEVWNLPIKLSNLLNNRKNTGKMNSDFGEVEVKRISLSYQGEWAVGLVGFSGGKWCWSSRNLDEELAYQMRSSGSCDEIIEFEMGTNGDYVFLGMPLVLEE